VLPLRYCLRFGATRCSPRWRAVAVGPLRPHRHRRGASRVSFQTLSACTSAPRLQMRSSGAESASLIERRLAVSENLCRQTHSASLIPARGQTPGDVETPRARRSLLGDLETPAGPCALDRLRCLLLRPQTPRCQAPKDGRPMRIRQHEAAGRVLFLSSCVLHFAPGGSRPP